uniref:Putative hydroxypyruvate isomerase n=1 Tax=Leptobrachium leishanense TaxID=445787 RepID=A0A8C5Q465_9ANUR
MPALRFSANLSWLFPEIPDLPGRIEAAAGAGFRYVEVAWPYDSDPGEIRAALRRHRVGLVLINTPPGDLQAGELGLAAVPGRQDGFRDGLEKAVSWAKDLGCQRIHIMSGRVPLGAERQSVEREMEETLVENLTYAAGVLSQAGLEGLIEPINTRITDPRYFLNTPHTSLIVTPRLSVRQDLYHWQIMDGNLTQNMSSCFPLIGHVQIAQVPHRNEPDSPGELNFMYLLHLLRELGYRGHVGCEYKPRGEQI